MADSDTEAYEHTQGHTHSILTQTLTHEEHTHTSNKEDYTIILSIQ